MLPLLLQAALLHRLRLLLASLLLVLLVLLVVVLHLVLHTRVLVQPRLRFMPAMSRFRV
jgi:hypothetical protein